MPNRPIHIQGVNKDKTLQLSDKGHTKTNPGDTVTWIIDNNSGVKSITGIDAKPGSKNVFSVKPAPVGSSKNWRGTIDPAISKEEDEDYYIRYKDDDGFDQEHDPKISVLPSGILPSTSE